MSLIWPNGSTSIPTVRSEFNPARKHPITGKVQPHRGIDLVGWRNIVSPVAGTITINAYQAGGAGYWVEVRETSTGDLFRFFHLRSRPDLRVGQHVRAGDRIGVMGETGSATGVHLHFEVWPGGRPPINPRDYYAQRSGDDDMTPEQYQTLIDTQRAVADIHRLLGAAGALNVIGPADNDKTIGYRVRDVQLALTSALPVLLGAAAETDPAAIAAAVVDAIPADLAADVLDLLAERIGAPA